MTDTGETKMVESEDGGADCEWNAHDETEAFLDDLVNDWLALRQEQDIDPPLSRADIKVFASPWAKNLAFWGDLDPAGSGFNGEEGEEA